MLTYNLWYQSTNNEILEMGIPLASLDTVPGRYILSSKATNHMRSQMTASQTDKENC